MPRGRSKRMSAWDRAVTETVARATRYRLRRVPNSPFLYVRDLGAPAGTKAQWSLAPLQRDDEQHVRQVADQILALGRSDWPVTTAQGPSAPSWRDVAGPCERDWEARMKGSSFVRYRSTLALLVERAPAQSADGLRGWALERTPGSNPFLRRLEMLSQVRRSLRPAWLPSELLEELRDLHRQAGPGRISDVQGMRGIPTRQEAEAYLDGLGAQHGLERWCLAMMLCYGLRNHELWWCGPLTTQAPGIEPGWTLIPGWWRTKSSQEHWAWPIYPDWVERYGLRVKQRQAQKELHRRRAPKIVSRLDQSKSWQPGDAADPGLCSNNHFLGGWISLQLRTVLPPWLARVPDTDGRYRPGDHGKQIAPYDLRHAWAVAVATDPAWRHVSDEHAARAMGHDVAVHQRRYQRWIGAAQRRDRAMAAVAGRPQVAVAS